MNYTREPIIETVITPKEGYKLIVRNSKGSGHEEYVVDALEVVSFGHSFFFRSMERPKSFLVPVTDYEIVEAKETRVVLKNASFERTIKIGGGREASGKGKEKEKTPADEPAAVEQRLEKKRERKRHRRRRPSGAEEKEPEMKQTEEAPKGGETTDESKPSSSTLSRLIPPPAQLIAEKISKQKSEAPKVIEGEVVPETVEEAKPSAEEKAKRSRRRKKIISKKDETPAASDESKPEEEKLPPDAEGKEMQRIAAESTEVATSSTSFSTVEEKSKFSFFGKIW